MANRNDTPCYGCLEREVTEKGNCHSYCKAYLEYRAEHLKKYEERWNNQELEYRREVNNKIKKKQARRRK